MDYYKGLSAVVSTNEKSSPMLTWLPNQISTVIVPYVKCPCLPDKTKSSTVQWEICIKLIYVDSGYMYIICYSSN